MLCVLYYFTDNKRLYFLRTQKGLHPDGILRTNHQAEANAHIKGMVHFLLWDAALVLD